jgi:hypothetical protein
MLRQLILWQETNSKFGFPPKAFIHINITSCSARFSPPYCCLVCESFPYFCHIFRDLNVLSGSKSILDETTLLRFITDMNTNYTLANKLPSIMSNLM